MDENEKYIGCYDWEGMPCEITASSEPGRTLDAVAYIPGKGFVPVDPFDVAYKGSRISTSAFKEFVRDLGRLRRAYPPVEETE